jgi:hypothetical protein
MKRRWFSRGGKATYLDDREEVLGLQKEGKSTERKRRNKMSHNNKLFER